MLDQVREFHGQLSEYYSQLSDNAEEQRVKMLLDHMSSHEQHLQSSLTAYEEDASRQVMDTYVDCIYCDEILAICEQTPVTPQMNVDSVIRTSMDVDNCLLRFYREVAANADCETVRDLFRNLIDMEEGELRKLAMNALGAKDM
jgi:rubrerythrin